METVDEHFVRRLRERKREAIGQGSASSEERRADPATLRLLFDAQVQSRHLDLAARWLQAQGKGYYTIGSAGHESNAALGLLSRVDDPALLHYRSGGFYAARARVGGQRRPGARRPAQPHLGRAATRCRAAGTRSSVIRALSIIPQTSTIGSHLPRAVGLAYALGLGRGDGRRAPWPEDAIVLCSFGDASANHSTAAGALNAASYLVHRGIPCPVLFVCEDNGIGISTRSPERLAGGSAPAPPRPGYRQVDGADPRRAAGRGRRVAGRRTREPSRRRAAPAHRPVHGPRRLGRRGRLPHPERDRRRLRARPAARRRRTRCSTPASCRPARSWTPTRRSGPQVMDEAERVLDEDRLATREAVMAPLALPDPTVSRPAAATAGRRLARHAGADAGAGDQRHSRGPDGRPSRGAGLRRRTSRSRAGCTASPAGCGSGSARAGCSTPCSTSRPSSGVALGAALAGFVPDPRDPVPRLPAQRRGPAARRGRDAGVLLRRAVPQRHGGPGRRTRLPARLRRALPQRQLARGAPRRPRAGARRAQPSGRGARAAAHLLRAGPRRGPGVRLPRADRALPHPRPPRGWRRRLDRRRTTAGAARAPRPGRVELARRRARRAAW